MDKLAVHWADWFYKPVRNRGFALSLVQASFRRIWWRGRCLESPIVQIPLIAPRGRLLWRLTHNVSVRLRPAYSTRRSDRFSTPFSRKPTLAHVNATSPPPFSHGRSSLSISITCYSTYIPVDIYVYVYIYFDRFFPSLYFSICRFFLFLFLSPGHLQHQHVIEREMLFGKHVERRGDTIDTGRHVIIPFDYRDRVNARAKITSE